VFSDIAVAANCILNEQPARVQRVLIVDLDVHQGNGNAVLFQGKPAVFTYSMHCKGNYFSAVEASDVDVEVKTGAGDDEYLAQLSSTLSPVFDEFEPQLGEHAGFIRIFYSLNWREYFMLNDSFPAGWGRRTSQ